MAVLIYDVDIITTNPTYILLPSIVDLPVDIENTSIGAVGSWLESGTSTMYLTMLFATKLSDGRVSPSWKIPGENIQEIVTADNKQTIYAEFPVIIA